MGKTSQIIAWSCHHQYSRWLRENFRSIKDEAPGKWGINCYGIYWRACILSAHWDSLLSWALEHLVIYCCIYKCYLDKYSWLFIYIFFLFIFACKLAESLRWEIFQGIYLACCCLQYMHHFDFLMISVFKNKNFFIPVEFIFIFL